MEHERVLPVASHGTLRDYILSGGGRGLDAARKLGPTGVVEHVLASGLRGRGGAGFPTGRKWETVLANASDTYPTTVVVNAAEGEPGSFKDRAILQRNAYAVLEGALIAALAVNADHIVVALKASFADGSLALRRALGELRGVGWDDDVDIVLFDGPREYLYGEETALLEAIDGRPPFPRIAPPYRHGVEELADDDSGEPAQIDMAELDHAGAPPTLVNNVETLANVPGILAYGPAWFREVGTDDSPGTIVCTITGATVRDGVAEVPMGTPLRSAIESIGGGACPGRRVVGAMSGVANPVLREDQLDTPLSYEAMQAAGSGLGAAGFIVFDDATDFAAVAYGVSRFLAVESCGQCTPCKQDGLALCELLDRVRRSEAKDVDLVAIDDHLRTITDSARCYLAYQHQRVVGSIVASFPDSIRAHIEHDIDAVADELVAPIVALSGDQATLDESQRTKQPDWTFDAEDSGKAPVDRLRGSSPS